jgi:hypothetical protein
LRNFNDFLYRSVDWDLSLFESIDNLKLILDEVLGVDDFNDFWYLDYFFLDNLNFSDIDVSRVDLDDLFNFDRNFLDYFLSGSDLDNLFNVFFDDFMDLD